MLDKLPTAQREAFAPVMQARVAPPEQLVARRRVVGVSQVATDRAGETNRVTDSRRACRATAATRSDVDELALPGRPQATSSMSASVGPHRAEIELRTSTLQRVDVMSLWCHNCAMADLKRATVYFDQSIHKALRVKAAQTDHSVSDLVNVAVRQSLAEDADDLDAFRTRAKEPDLAFEDVLEDLRRRGKL